MWPLERKRDVLRIGRERAEYWAQDSIGLVLRGRLMLAAEPGAGEILETELRTWLQVRGGQIPRARSVDVVLESAWLPAMVIETGRTSWSRGQAENLMRHRFTELHMRAGAPVDDWKLQLDHRPGDAQALGYGLASSTRQAVLGATAAAGQRAASLQPALAWGRQRLARRGRSLRAGWWIWIEQDRALVCRIEHGRMTAMNAGAPVPSDEEQCARLVAIEAARWGILDAGDAMVMASWQDLVAPDTETSTRETPSQPEATT